jgi:hypothetical protein
VEGAYREPGSVAGLPFARKRLGAFVVAAVVTAGLLTFLSLVGFAPGTSLSRHYVVVRDGLWGMYVLLLLALVMPGALAWPATRLVHGRRAPALLLFAACVAPRLLGSVFSWVGWRMMDRVLVGLLGSAVPRIVAEGTSESSGPVVLGDLVSAACCAVVAIGAGGALGTIDVDRLEKSTPRDRSIARATTIVGAAWTLASLALFIAFVRGRGVTNISLVVLLAVAGAAVLAVTIARRAPMLRAHHDSTEARAHFFLALLTGICAVLAIVLYEHALVVRTDAYAFWSVAGESVDPTQRVRILEMCLPARAYAAIAIPLHAAFGIVTFGLAAMPARMRVRAAMQPWKALVAVLLLASLAAVFTFEHVKAQRRLAIANAAFDTDPVMLATVEPSGRNESLGTWRRLLFDESGAVREEITPDAEDEEAMMDSLPAWDEGYLMPVTTIEVFADQRLACSALFDGLRARQKTRSRLAVLAHPMNEDGHAIAVPDVHPLGELGPLATAPIDIVGFGIDTFSPATGTVGARVLPDRAMGLTCGAVRQQVSLADEGHGAAARAVVAACGAWFHVDERAPFAITYGKECTVRDLAHTMAALDAAFPNAYKRGRIFHVHAE